MIIHLFVPLVSIPLIGSFFVLPFHTLALSDPSERVTYNRRIIKYDI